VQSRLLKLHINFLVGWEASLQALNGNLRKLIFRDMKQQRKFRLIWRDSLEVVKDLFSNPVFAKYMTYSPHEVRCGEECEYSEFFTGTRASAIQVSNCELCAKAL